MADGNTETTTSPTVAERSCALCGEDKSNGPLLLLFECQHHYVHQECQRDHYEAKKCPECRADLRPQLASLFKTLFNWVTARKPQLVVTLIAFVVLLPVSVACKMYTDLAEVRYEVVQVLRQRDTYWQYILREPTLFDWRYISASLLYKLNFFALGCLIGWDVTRYPVYWQTA